MTEPLHAAVGAPLTAAVSTGRICKCCKSHNPNVLYVHQHHIWPRGHGGPDVAANRVWLCPTAHYNIHGILAHMLVHNGVKPRGRQNAYHLEIARRGYESILAQSLR